MLGETFSKENVSKKLDTFQVKGTLFSYEHSDVCHKELSDISHLQCKQLTVHKQLQLQLHVTFSNENNKRYIYNKPVCGSVSVGTLR